MSGHTFHPTILREYDIRGIVDETLFEADAYAIGRSFGVLHIKGMALDVAIPRKDSKTGRGHRGFVVDLDPELDFEEAARRRDLTINSIGYDPLDGEILDPHHGVSDLRAGRLRATDPSWSVAPAIPQRSSRVR